MKSNVPTVRQIAWVSMVPQLILMGLIISIYYLLDFGDPFLSGLLTYLILSFGLRSIVAKDHRQGIKLVKQQQFADAIPLFEKSVEFFTQNTWVDKYRFLTLLSSSKMTYKEMGLCNIAFCHSQIGNGLMAKEYYEQTLSEFPENGVAKAGLNLIKSVGQTTQTET